MYGKFMELCEDINFDIETAREVLTQMDVSKAFEYAPRWQGKTYYTSKFTPLTMAIFYCNLRMVELLLSFGADPNVIFDGEAVLWDLQYNDGETDDENENRLKIAQLLLEFGADPLIDPENTGESLFDYVVFAVFNDGFNDLWEYLSRFLVLLVAYGAESKYCKPRIVGKFDRSNMKQYDFFLVPEENNKYSGVIKDRQGNIIAFI